MDYQYDLLSNIWELRMSVAHEEECLEEAETIWAQIAELETQITEGFRRIDFLRFASMLSESNPSQ